IRIQTLPPFLMKRVMATRAASICRAVMRLGSIALSAYSPKAMRAPRLVLPLIALLAWGLRNLTRLGISIGGLLGRGLLGQLLARHRRVDQSLGHGLGGGVEGGGLHRSLLDQHRGGLGRRGGRGGLLGLGNRDAFLAHLLQELVGAL